MSELRQALGEYLAIRRSLGFELRLPGSLLHRFVAFVEAEDAPHITTELALKWAKEPADALPSTWAWRLAMVRRFALWYSVTDPRTQVPPEGLLPHRYRRKPPYIYTDDEIECLIRVAWQLPSPRGLRAHTYATLFGLLAVTGMRINEALKLDRVDVGLVDGILSIRRTKFGKSRLVPVHPSSREALKAYAETRDRILPDLSTPAFFVSERRTDHGMDRQVHVRESLPAHRASRSCQGPRPRPTAP